MPTKRARRTRTPPRSSRPRMPGYGLPRSREGLLAWSWAERRLKNSRNYWIATSRPDGSPHVMVVWGLWRDGSFYFSTGATSRKARNLARRPQCIICSERAEQAVIVEGTAELLRDAAARKRFGKEYQAKYAWDMSDFREPVYVVQPRLAFGLFEKDFVGTATRWRFGE